MAPVKPCVCMAMLVADKVFREEGTSKCHIAGTFSVIHASTFPVVHDTMHVYLALSDAIIGTHTGRVVFAYADGTEKELVKVEGPIEIKDRLHVVELNFCFRRVRFPKPGNLEISFFLDGEYVMHRQFTVKKSEGPPKPQ